MYIPAAAAWDQSTRGQKGDVAIKPKKNSEGLGERTIAAG